MAATKTVNQLQQSHNLIPRNGVVTVFGYGIQVRVDSGHLLIEDGIGTERRRYRLPRVRHGLKRLVVIGSDGMVSLSALRWLADQDAAFSMLDRDGSVLATTGPVRSSDARLRRAQALSQQNGTALEIAKELIAVKLTGQESLVRDKLNDSTIADAIARFRERLSAAEKIDTIRLLEAHAAVSYWSCWNTLPVNFPRQDVERVPKHWRTFGTRKSPLTGSPRLAVTPPGAILNYCYSLLESETLLATAALGLDPAIGMLHADTPNRNSLSCDIMEPIRPAVDAWVLDWITREPLRRSWFFETATGNCRLMGDFASKLSETAPTWGRLVAPYAERVALKLFASTSRSKPTHRLATPLTQQHRREAKGRPSLPFVKRLRPDNICRDCGEQIRYRALFCSKCAVIATGENFDAGRKSAQQPKSLAKRSATQRLHQQGIQNWKPSDLPGWLTRDVYVRQIQPALASVEKSRIKSTLVVSETDAFDFTKINYEIVGQIFERMLRGDERHRFGQHYTRSEIVDLINSFCIRNPADKVFDPACGGGTFLVRAYDRKRSLSQGHVTHNQLIDQLFGLDISTYPVHLTTINLATRDLVQKGNYPLVARKDFFTAQPTDDVFHIPAMNSGSKEWVKLPIVDAVVGNPPYVRHEKIDEYYGVGYKARLLQVLDRDAPEADLSGRSDILCYFFTHALASRFHSSSSSSCAS